MFTWMLYAGLALAADLDALRADTSAVMVDARKAFDAQEYDRALALAKQAVTASKPLPKRDIVRQNARLRLADAEYGLGLFEDAMRTLEEVIKHSEAPETIEEVEILVEACSNMGAVQHARGDLNDAREWHQTAWSALLHYQLFTPIRFVVARQFAYTARAQSDFTTARTLLEWVLTSIVAEVGPDHPSTANSQLELAYLLDQIGEPKLALEQAQAARASLSVSRPASLELATADRSIADISLTLQDLNTARSAFEQSWSTLVGLFGEGDPRLQQILATRAALRFAEGDYEPALADWKTLLGYAVERLGPTHPEVAHKRAGLGAMLRDLSRFQSAEQEFTAALTLLEQALGPDDPQVASIRALRAQVWLSLGRYHDAIQEFKVALDVLDASASHLEDAVRARSMMANAYQQIGDLEAALENHNLARSKAGPLQLPKVTADVDNAYAVLLVGIGRAELAEQLLRRSLRATEEIFGADHPHCATLLHNLAFAVGEDGRPHDALELMERAVAIERAAYGENSLAQAQSLMELGSLQYSVFDHERAASTQQQALALLEKGYGPHHPLVALAIDDLTLTTTDQVEREALARRSLAIRLRSDPPGSTESYVLLATALTGQQRQEEALQAMESALSSKVSTLENPATRLSYRTSHARTLANVGRLDEAIDELRAIHENPLLKTNKTANRQASFLLGEYLYEAGAKTEAREHLARALRGLEVDIEEAFGRMSTRSRMNLATTYRNQVGTFLMANVTANPEQAYNAVVRWKGIATRSVAVEQPAILASAAPEAFGRWQAVGQEMSTLALSSDAEVIEKLENLTTEKEELREQLRGAASETIPTFDSVNALELSHELPKDTVLVDYIRHAMGPPGAQYQVYTAFLIWDGSIKSIVLGGAGQIDDAISAHRELLSSRAPTRRSDRAGKQLREMIWDPLQDVVEGKDSIYIVPDSTLAIAAFAALPTGQGYLVDDHDLRILDSALDIRPRTSDASGRAVVVGGVSYSADADAVADALTPPSNDDDDDAPSTRSACSATFSPLPGTLNEAEKVNELLGDDSRLLIGAAASQQGITEAIAGASTLHLATHGFFASGNCRSQIAGRASEEVLQMNPMLLSGVALAGANDDRSAIWTAEEIATLPLNDLDLVVLSACESGLGTIEDGEGVQGLRRAFALAGARATVMSLWPVEDAPTQALMGRFYEILLADPDRDEVKALRGAQRWLRDRNIELHGTARPQTWAGFVVAGSPRAR